MPAHSTPAPRLEAPDELKTAARWDDRILALVMLVLGGPRVILAFAEHETFGAEATIAAIVAGLGLLLLLTTGRRR
jgi:hypothetical protein